MSTLVRLSAIAVSSLFALPAFAAQRTFVASFGLDANNCSIIAPCRSFTRALTQTDANGEVIVLDSAGYGAVTISQSVSIIAPEGVYAGISVFPGQHGIVVNGADVNVTLRGLAINGQGGNAGIRIENAAQVFIEKVTVANTGKHIFDAAIHVAPGATVAGVFVTDTTVRNTAGFGIRIEANTGLAVDRCRIEANGNVAINGGAPSGRLTVSDSFLTLNQGAGISVFATSPGSWQLTVARSTVERNSGDGVFVGGGIGGAYRVTVTDSVVQGNVTGGNGIHVFVNPGETANALVGDSRIAGNASGIRCAAIAEGTATMIAERNAVVGNGRAFDQLGTCAFESMGNNAARNNTNADTGTITTVLPR